MSEEKVRASGWEQAEEWSAPPWLKIEDGESAKLVFLEGPTKVEKTFSGKVRTFQRFKVYNQSADRTQDFDCGKGAFLAVSKAHSKAGADFNRTLFLVSRSGTGKSTTYSVSKLETLSDDQLAKLTTQPEEAPVPF